VRIALVFPELLGTYGDGGNALVARERLRRRGIGAEVEPVAIGDRLPAADLYLLGGGEDGPQRLAADRLRESDLAARVADGASVFAVCAGLQVIGRHFAVAGDDLYEGVGLVDAATARGERRSVGELATRVDGRWLVGFENHGGVTTLGEGVEALGTVTRGRGNDGVVDGLRAGRVWATYAHGPVLAMNPWFCDALLEMVLGVELEALALVADRLYAERLRSLRLGPAPA
jgi:CobQ-like glutamine amidotransferase family enzyme